MTRSHARAAFIIVTAAFLAAPILSAQQSTEADKALLANESFVRPPAEVAKLVTAPRQQNSTLSQQSPDRRHFLVLHAEGLGSEQKFARSHIYLGGLQVDEQANRVRTFTTRGQAGIEIVDAESGARTMVQLPNGATASSPAWSPDGSKIAYFANFDGGSYLYVADAKSGVSRRLTERAALPVLATQLDWAPDGSAVYAVLIPVPRAAAPKEPAVATGPLVRMTNSQKHKTPTYASLLGGPFQKEQLE